MAHVRLIEGSLRSFLSISCLTWLVLGAVATVRAAPWEIETVHAHPARAWLAVTSDELGEPIVAMGGASLRVARPGPGGWDIETVIEECGRSTTVDSHPVGGLAMTHYREGELWLVWLRDGSWEHHVIPHFVDESPTPRVVFDSVGRPFVFFTASTGPGREHLVRRWTGDDWAEDELATDNGRGLWVSTGPTGEPSAAMPRGQGFEIFTWDGGSWSFEDSFVSSLLPTPPPEKIVLAHDPSGEPAVLMGDQSSPPVLFRRSVGGWTETNVPSTGTSGLGLLFESDGTPLMVADGTAWRWPDGGSWESESLVASGDVHAQPLAMGAGGEPLFASVRRGYRDVLDAVVLQRRVAGTWESDEIVSSRSADGQVQAELDETGEPLVAWEADDQLVVAWKDGGAWVEQVLAPDERFESFALGLDRGSRPVIVSATSTGTLRILRRQEDRSWSLESIDLGVEPLVDEVPKLTRSPEGDLALTLVTRNAIVLVREEDGAWDTLRLVVEPDPTQARLAFDARGRVALSAIVSGSLRVYREREVGWREEHVHDQGRPDSIDLGLGLDGRLRLAWQDHQELGLAIETEEGWELGPATTVGAVSSFDLQPANLALASSGMPLFTASKSLADLGFGSGGPVVGRLLADREWLLETVDPRQSWTPSRDLLVTAEGQLMVAYQGNCGFEVLFARSQEGSGAAGEGAPPRLLRLAVDDLSPGWAETVLPLTTLNDDETPPFPAPLLKPDAVADDLPGGRLVLYRWEDDEAGEVCVRKHEGRAFVYRE